VVFAALSGACGSSSKKSVTKDDFIAQADGICQNYGDLAGRASKNLRHPGPRQIAVIQDRLVPLLQRRDDELAQLTPPAADRETVAKFIADLKAATDDVLLNPAGYAAAHGATPLLRKAADEAAAYGFSVCARL
jgi:hypothetical protein